MKGSEILRAAKALIATEKTWTTGVSARDAQGRLCLEEEGVRWCAYGALRHASHSTCYGLLHLLESAAYELYDTGVVHVNDCLGFKAVHKVYDHAIEVIEKAEVRE